MDSIIEILKRRSELAPDALERYENRVKRAREALNEAANNLSEAILERDRQAAQLAELQKAIDILEANK